MRWLKHLVSTPRDPKVAELLEAEGLAGYGALWRIYEVVAEQMGPLDTSCACEYTLRQWAIVLGCHRNRAIKYLAKLADCELLVMEQSGNRIRVNIPKLAELRDEYSKKSGRSPESLRRDSSQIRSDHITSETKEGVDSVDNREIPKGKALRKETGGGFDRVGGIVKAVGLAHQKEAP